MVGLNIPVTVEVLPESLRKISRDINASVSSLSPEFNIDTDKIKQAVEFGLEGQTLDIQGLSAAAKTLIGRQLNEALVGRIDKLTVTADAKRDAAREIADASENVDILLNVDKIKSDFAEATKEAKDLFDLSNAAADNVATLRKRAAETQKAFESERDRPSRLENLPQSGGSARAGENLKELRNLDKLEEEAAVAAKDLKVFTGVLLDISSSFEKASIKAEELGDSLAQVGDTSLEEQKARLSDAFRNQFQLVDRESKQFRQSINDKLKSSRALRNLTGAEARAASVAAAGVTDAESLKDARSKLAAILVKNREERNRSKIVELITEEGRLKRVLQEEVNRVKRRKSVDSTKQRQQREKLVANIGKNAAKREQARIKAINDSIKAFTQQTGEVLKGADAQKQLFAKIRETLRNTTAEGGGRGLGDSGGIQGTGSLQNFAQQLDPQQLRAFQSALGGINTEVQEYGRSLNDSNAGNVRFGTLNSKNTKGVKSFGASLKGMAGAAALAFKRLLLYTVVSQIIFGLVKSLKEAVAAVIELDTQARRLQFFANISKDIATETEKVNSSITTLQSSFDAVTNTAIRFGVGLKEATEALVTVARVGQDVQGTFSDTVIQLVRLEGGALGAETAVRNLNAIQEQFLRGLDEYATGADAAAVATGRIGREATLSAALIQGLGATIAVTAAQSSLNVSELSDVVARVGAAFSNLQGTDPVTLIGLVGKAASVSGANVGRLATGLKQAATLIIQNAEDIESLTGIKVFDQGSVRGLPAILEVLNAASKAGGGRQRAILGQLFDRRSLDVGAALAAAVGEITKETGKLASEEDIANRVRDNTIKFLEGQANVAGGLDAALNRLDVTVKAIVANEEFTKFLGSAVNLFTALISKTVSFLAPLNRMGEFVDGTSSTFKILGDSIDFIRFNLDGFIAVLQKVTGISGVISVIEKLAEVVNLFITGVSQGTGLTDSFLEALTGLSEVAGLAIQDTIDVTALLVGSGFKFLGAIAASNFGDGVITGLSIISPIFASAVAAFGGDSDTKLASLGTDLGNAFTKQFTDAIEKSASAFRSVAEGRAIQSAATKESNKLEGERQRLAAKAFFDAQKEKAAAENKERILIEKDVNIALEERANLIRQLAAAQGDVNKTIELENAIRLNGAAIFAQFDERQQGLRALARERVRLEREIVLEQQNQASELEKLNSLATILSANLSKEQKLQLDIDVSTVEFSKKIAAAEVELSKLATVLSLSALTDDGGDKAREDFQKKERELVSLKRAQAVDAFNKQKEIVDLSFSSTTKQIDAWESAAEKVASAFSKVVELQRGLADIFNRAGELASQRLSATAGNVNAFLERSGASIEQRLSAARQQSAAQLALLERNGRRQIESLERTAGSDTFGTEEQIQTDTNRLIDSIIAANQIAQDEIVNQETKSINIEAAARRQVAGELRSEFDLRVNATRNEIAIRQRLIGQEITLLQEKVQAERRFADLREDQQVSFGRLLIESPQKFADTLKDFNFAKSFFRNITDINLEGLQQIQGRLARVLQAFGPEGVQQLARGLENAVKFGLADVIQGVGNEEALRVISRLATETPAAIDRSIKEDEARAREITAEQQRIKLLQTRQAALVEKDAKIQDSQLKIAAADLDVARTQRVRIIELLGKELREFQLANENLKILQAISATTVVAPGATETIDLGALRDAIREEARQANVPTTAPDAAPPVPDLGLDKVTKDFAGLSNALNDFIDDILNPKIEDTKESKEKTDPTPDRPITPRGLPFDPFPRFNPDDLKPEPIDPFPRFNPADLIPPEPEVAGSSPVSIDEIDNILRKQAEGVELTFVELARLQKALRDRTITEDGFGRQADPFVEIGPDGSRRDNSDVVDDLEGALDRAFPGPTIASPIPDNAPAPSDRLSPPSIPDDFPNIPDVTREFNERNERAAKALEEAAKALKEAAEAKAAQDEKDRKFIEESPLFKEADKAEILSVSESLARSIAEGVNSALVNGGDVLGEKIAEQIKGKKIEVEIPETVIRVELDGRITTELNGDKFFADLTSALEGTGLNTFQIEAIKRRIVQLTKNQRDAGANVPFNGEIDN